MTAPLLQAQGLARRYALPRTRLLGPAPQLHALRGVDFSLARGRSLGVVGESGSGKSTLARLVMALEPPSAGRVLFDGQDLQALDAAALRRARAGFQMVFQDPFGSLDPRQTVGRIVAEPLAAQAAAAPAGSAFASPRARLDRAAEVLDAVGLRPGDTARYPHEFSGGQRQRIAIARALVTAPRLIVADEPVSALDVSVQAQVLNLMQDLQDRLGLSYLFISHDLAVVDLVSDEVLVLYQGRVVEQGSPEQLFRASAHPYTRALLDAAPRLGAAATPRPPRRPLPPLAAAPAGGCDFAPRCPWRRPACLAETPALRTLAGSGPAGAHRAACHRAEDLLAGVPAQAAESAAA